MVRVCRLEPRSLTNQVEGRDSPPALQRFVSITWCGLDIDVCWPSSDSGSEQLVDWLARVSTALPARCRSHSVLTGPWPDDSTRLLVFKELVREELCHGEVSSCSSNPQD